MSNILNNDNKVKKTDKYKPVLIITILIGILLVGLIILFANKFTKNKNDYTVDDISYIEPLKALDEATAAQLIKENIVKVINTVEDTEIVGTGFFIKEGYLITNSHVVDVEGEISVEFYDGTTMMADLYSNSINFDLALLKVDSLKAKALSFGNSSDLEITNDVLAAGYIYNFAGESSIAKGILSALRIVDGITYLQSDINIDTGASGGPLFNGKAEVIGINTFVTENRTFTISLSSESAQMIIDLLLENPNVEYLTSLRPSNPINKILVEVKYTDDNNLNLYNDDKIIEKSNELNKDNRHEEKREVYYCEEGYTLVGKSCVKQISYEADKKVNECKEGYTLSGDMCVFSDTKNVKIKYTCSSENLKLNSENKCVFDGYEQTVFTNDSRYGSCPKGKKCFNLGPNEGVTFITNVTCPSGSTEVTSGKYVWNGEDMNELNYKTFNRIRVYGKLKSLDLNGLEYYEDTTGIYIATNCAKSYDSKTGVYTFYTYEELQSSACPSNGVLTKSIDSNGVQGFYCTLNVNPDFYAYDVACINPEDELVFENGQIMCRKWVTKEYMPLQNKYCDSGYSLENDVCKKTDILPVTYTYLCEKGDILQGRICVKNNVVAADKKIVDY